MKNDIVICESINKCTNKNHSISHCHYHSFVATNSEGFHFANYYQFGKLNFHYFLGHYGYINKFATQNKQILLEMTFSCEFNRECGIAHIDMPDSSKVNKTTTLTTAKTGSGRWRLSRMLIWLVKIQKWGQKWTFHSTFYRKSGITLVSLSICF